MDSLTGPEIDSTVMVNVESVFNEGMIVVFNSSDGQEYRGALLRTSQCGTCRYAYIHSIKPGTHGYII